MSFSLLFLGVGGWVFVGSTGRQISSVIQVEFSMLGVIRDITRDSSVTRRQVAVALGAASEIERIQSSELAKEATKRNEANFTRFRSLLAGERMAEFDELERSRVIYLQKVRVALEEFPTNEEDMSAVDKLFGEYQELQDSLAASVQDMVIAKKEKFEKRLGFLSLFFILVALWPFVVAFLLFAYLMLHTAFLFFFAQKEART